MAAWRDVRREMHLELNQVRRRSLSRGLRRFAWLLALVVLGVAGFVAFAIVPPWIGILLSNVERPLRRRTALAFLDGLPVVYALALISAIIGTSVLVYLRFRARARGFSVLASSLQARLLLLCASVLLSLLALEAGAAAWRGWLHLSPRLPRIGLRASSADKVARTVPSTGTSSRLSNQFPAQEGGLARPQGRYGSWSSASQAARGALPPLAVGWADRRLATREGISRSSDRGQYVGRGRSHPRDNA